MRLVLIICLLLGLAVPACAQDDDAGFLPGVIERQLSGDGRQVRLRGVNGLLSSQATVAEITIADDTGVWLRISNAQVDWKRRDLFSGKLTVNRLTAESVAILRRPVSNADLPSPEARALAVPELPVAVNIGELRIDSVEFAEEVFGLKSRLEATGSMLLAGGDLDAALDMVRLDGAGGSARLRVAFRKASDVFDISLNIAEPEQGVIANALNIEGRPALGLQLAGQGPVSSLDLVFALDTAGERRISGSAFLRQGDAGLTVAADFAAEIGPLAPPAYAAVLDRPVRGAIEANQTATGWQIGGLELTGAGLAITANGSLDGGSFLGEAAISSDDIGKFSGLAGASLAGAGTFALTGTVAPVAGTFDLTLTGSATGLAAGGSPLAALMRGETSLAGRLSRDATALRADQLILSNDRVSAVIDGELSSSSADLEAELDLADLADLGGPVAGAGKAEVTVKGGEARFGITADVTVPVAIVAGKPLDSLAFNLAGELAASVFDGKVAASAVLAGQDATLDAALVADAAGLKLDQLEAGLAGAILRGALAVAGSGAMDGRVSLQADSLAGVGAIFGLELAGQIGSGEISASHDGASQHFDLAIGDAAVTSGAVALTEVSARASVDDAFGAAVYNAELASGALRAGGIAFRDTGLLLDNASGVPGFSLTARRGNATMVNVRGRLLELGPMVRIGLDAASAAEGTLAVALKAPTEITVAGGGFSVTPAVFQSGGGELTVQGAFGPQLDARVSVTGFPLGASALFAGEQALAGTVTGQVAGLGSWDDPQLTFDLVATAASHRMTRQFGLQDFDLAAKGSLAGSVLRVVAASARTEGLSVSGSGDVPVDGTGLDFSLQVERADLAVFDRWSGGRGLSGILTGSAQISGDLRQPTIAYGLSGLGLSLAGLREAGVADFNAAAAGTYADGIVRLGPTSISAPGGLGLQATGSASINSGAVAVSLSGELPLALVNGLLAGRGARADGRIKIAARIAGTLAAPTAQGSLTIQNGTFTDTAANLRLNRVALEARFSGQSLIISSGSARSSAGGGLALTGQIGFAGGQLVPDIALQLQHLTYADGRTVVTRIDGGLALRGPLNGGAALTGDITLEETQVVIPEGAGAGSRGELPEVRHVGQRAKVQQTLDRVAATLPKTASRTGTDLRIDVSVTAPGRFFVRGRGLDAELRGNLRITGLLRDVVPVGSFEMIRGRMAILGQRLEFREGRVTLEGDLDPVLDFRAEVARDEVTAIVTVSGSAAEPEVTFSSVPERPQDEVIALLIFNSDLAELSAFQLVQLAAAVRELQGGRDSGLLSQLRKSTGLDDLDIQTGEDGRASVRAGKYIEENIYLELQAGAEGTSRATVNLDLGGDVEAEIFTGSDGDSGIGIAYEQDY